MTENMKETTPTGNLDETAVFVGRVKWFNNKAGYGFATVVEGTRKDEDIFVHHSGIRVASEQYKYLVQGEYVSFKLRHSENASHPYQATELRGVAGGMLMCETRNEARQTRGRAEGEGEQNNYGERGDRRRGHNAGGRVRVHGGGPREGETWTLVREDGRRAPPRRRKRDEA